ncbi:MAG: hypothetical protein HY349_07440, partial [Nitrospirae bacterium]|nr:hypothetical protein [Nitrospirota bacterium]
RMGGLGVANWQIEDGFNIFINPAQLSNYKNEVNLELGTWAPPGGDVLTTHPFGGVNNDRVGAWGGMNSDVSYGTWGLYLGRPYSGPLTLMDATPPAASWFDLFYSTKGPVPMGFYLSYANQVVETSNGTDTADNSSELNLGAGAILMNGMLDVAVNLGMPDFECENNAACGSATGKIEGDAGINIALLGRYHVKHTGGKYLLTGRIMQADATMKGGGDTKLLTLNLDATCNSKPNADTLMIAGIGIAMTDGKVLDDDRSSLSLPVNVAVEHQTFKKVKTRVGLSKAIYTSTSTDVTTPGPPAATTTTDTVDGDAAAVSMGFGWAIADNLSLDAVINQDILFTGSYMVSGIPETLSTAMGLTYRMK